MTDRNGDSPDKSKGLYFFRPKRPQDGVSPDQSDSREPQGADVASPVESSAESMKASRAFKGQTLRLNLTAWRQLRHLAIEQDATAHSLLIEALNDLFKKYQKPPVA